MMMAAICKHMKGTKPHRHLRPYLLSPSSFDDALTLDCGNAV